MVTQCVEQNHNAYHIILLPKKSQFNGNETILTINSNIYKQKNIYLESNIVYHINNQKHRPRGCMKVIQP